MCENEEENQFCTWVKSNEISELCRLYGWSRSALQLMMILTSFLWRWSSMSLFSSFLHVGIETEATVNWDNFEQ